MRGLIRTPTSKLTEEQWQALRHKFVVSGKTGGSDAGTLLGLNKYKSPINLFYQAVGIATLPNKMNMPMLHGKNLEDYVGKCWQYWDGTEDGFVERMQTKNKYKNSRRIKAILENPKYPNLFANVDSIIVDHPFWGKQKGVLELKTISSYASDSYEDGIPPNYVVQAHLYMLVTGLEYAEIGYLKDGRDIGVVEISRDEALQQMILDAAQAHRDRVLAAQKAIAEFKESGAWSGDDNELYGIAQEFEPPADNSEAYKMFISERHKARENEIEIEGDDEDANNLFHLCTTKENIKELEDQKQLYENRLRAKMQHASAAVMKLKNGKVSWRKIFTAKLS